MKTLLVLCSLLLTACSSMTLNQKRALTIGAYILAIGAIEAHGHGDNRPALAHDIETPRNPCEKNPTSCK